jgi:hypothetical protein
VQCLSNGIQLWRELLFSVFYTLDFWFIKEAISCQTNNDADHISEEVLKKIDAEVKTYLKCKLYKTSEITERTSQLMKLLCVILLLKALQINRRFMQIGFTPL